MKAVIFDCDGVLVNTETILSQVKVDVLADLGVSFSVAESDRMFLGTMLEDRHDALNDMSKQQVGKELPTNFWDNVIAEFDARVKEDLPVTEGVYDVISALHKTKLGLAVGSNSPVEDLRHVMAVTQLDKYFGEHVYSQDHVGVPKPAPDLFAYAMNKLGAEKETTIVIEDSATGVRAASDLGAYIIGFTGHAPNPVQRAEKLRAAGAHEIFTHMPDIKVHIFELLQS